ncbi:ClpP/crotonase [Patellaria atrata CBS 101060]|uniref:ClpP/crotonase n=1 Tax=Patellaria atrata CBS 101060 TaxID=1346257 RepID=A0A9P4VSQ6_9PEZI|nr:ClpP/crotonase [Patellaria atrata CBS 101060]
MSSESYQYEYFNVSFPKQYVAHVEINRPDKLNAFIEIMWLNLSKLIRRMSYDPEVRCIILTGAGDRAFTAGLDVQAASQGLLSGNSPDIDVARKANDIRRHILEFQDCITALEKCEKPIITLLHGISYGLALDICLATDIRLSTTSTRLSIKEIDIGLAADIGTLSRLPKAVSNMSWVKTACLTGKVFDSNEALSIGLVSGVYGSKTEGWTAALELAGTIAEKSPVAAVATKELLNWSRDHSVDDGLKYTAVLNAAMVQTRDVKNALLSGLQKRKPTFEKL